MTSTNGSGEMTSQLIDDPLFRQRLWLLARRRRAAGRDLDGARRGVLAEHVHANLDERYEVLEEELTRSPEGDSGYDNR
jgi:hypothetical protein